MLQRSFPSSLVTEREEKGAVHSQSLLMSLRNNQCQNYVTLVFTILLVTYGAGTRMVNMLNKVGLTLHWDTLMSFLDRYNKKEFDKLHSNIPAEKPLLLLLDNVNIHRDIKGTIACSRCPR